MAIRVVGVVGAGLMGAGIIEQAARCGYTLVARDISVQAVQSAQERIGRSLDRGMERGKLDAAQRAEAEARIRWTTSLEDLGTCDLVVEAAIENVDLKRDLFRELDSVTSPATILASNTSSVSITTLAAATQRPDRVAGAHFFNPVPVMPLVELVRGLLTSDETMDTLRGFGESLQKQVVVAKDTPGFIVNYLLIPYLLDAARAVQNEMATVSDIDTAMKLGTGVPMGPLTLLDFIGVDTTLYIADVMYEAFRDPKYAAPPILRNMVNAGKLGKKNGRGFYDYNAG